MEPAASASDNILRDLLDAKGLWVKQSAEGQNSLMRALSNAIYFTEIYHSLIQKVITSFVRQNRIFVRRSFLISSETLELFLSNPSLPEYESFNLEIAACLFDCRIKLFYSSDISLCSDLFYHKTATTLKLIRIFDNHYSAVFSKDFKRKAVFAQNIVLSIANSAIDSIPFQIQEYNRGKLFNFEYENWARISSTPLPANFSVKSDSLSLSRYQESFKKSSYSTDSFNSKRMRTGSSLGIDILSILQLRKDTSKEDPAISFLESKYEDLMNNICRMPDFDSMGDIRDPISNEIFDFEIDLQEVKPMVYEKDKMEAIFEEQYNDNWNTEVTSPDKDENPLSSKSEEMLALTENQYRYSPEPETRSPINGSSCNSPGKKLTLRDKMKQKNQAQAQPSFAVNENQFSQQDQDNFMKGILPDDSAANIQSWISTTFDLGCSPEKQSKKEGNTGKTRKVKEKLPNGVISKKIHEGRLKYYDDKNKFGFIIADIKGKSEDIFIYGVEFEEAGINIDLLKNAGVEKLVKFKFNVASYFGKYKRSKKAVNLQLADN